MKKILFILFTVQSVLAPHITKSYSVNSIEDSYEYSIVNQEKKTVKKDILGNTIIEDDNGNKITIKKDILGNIIIEGHNGDKITIKKDILGNITIENNNGNKKTIKEDILGFNHISIQAKRYALDNNVQRHEVQSFVGAVAGTPSKKGVFITTSDYTKGAMEYVESLNGSPTIILINGQQLTEYIYDYGLGLQTEKVLKVMKMDMDYWDAMDNA